MIAAKVARTRFSEVPSPREGSSETAEPHDSFVVSATSLTSPSTSLHIARERERREGETGDKREPFVLLIEMSEHSEQRGGGEGGRGGGGGGHSRERRVGRTQSLRGEVKGEIFAPKKAALTIKTGPGKKLNEQSTGIGYNLQDGP